MGTGLGCHQAGSMAEENAEPLAWGDLLALGPGGSFYRRRNITLGGEIRRPVSRLHQSVSSVVSQVAFSVVGAFPRAEDPAVNPLYLFVSCSLLPQWRETRLP